VGDRHWEESFEIRPNPSLNVPAADLKAQADLLNAIRDDLSAIHTALGRIQEASLQVKAIAERANKIGKGAALQPAADSLLKSLDASRDQLNNPKIRTNQDSLNYLPKIDFQFAGLAGMVESADARPTAAELARYAELKQQLTAILAGLSRVLENDLAAFNRSVRELDIPPVVVP
jgi:hypothetical protein